MTHLCSRVIQTIHRSSCRYHSFTMLLQLLVCANPWLSELPGCFSTQVIYHPKIPTFSMNASLSKYAIKCVNTMLYLECSQIVSTCAPQSDSAKVWSPLTCIYPQIYVYKTFQFNLCFIFTQWNDSLTHPSCIPREHHRVHEPMPPHQHNYSKHYGPMLV